MFLVQEIANGAVVAGRLDECLDGEPFARLQQRFTKVGVTEVDPVELTVELRQLTPDLVLPGSPRLPPMVPRDPLASEFQTARLRMRAGSALHLGML